MKNFLLSLSIISCSALLITSCTKMDLNNPDSSHNQLKKVDPNVLDCGTGYHWDYYLKKCVADCPTGYHNDSITGACVVDGGGGGGIVPDQISVITNPNNPDDSAVARHNQVMDLIIGNINSGTSTDDIIQYTLNDLVALSYDTSELRNEYNLSVSIGTFGYIDVDSLAYKMYANSEISNTAENYLVDLSLLLNNVIGDNDPTESIYEVFANDAITYENSISLDNSLS